MLGFINNVLYMVLLGGGICHSFSMSICLHHPPVSVSIILLCLSVLCCWGVCASRFASSFYPTVTLYIICFYQLGKERHKMIVKKLEQNV